MRCRKYRWPDAARQIHDVSAHRRALTLPTDPPLDCKVIKIAHKTFGIYVELTTSDGKFVTLQTKIGSAEVEITIYERR